jgi:hypothetical protein
MQCTDSPLGKRFIIQARSRYLTKLLQSSTTKYSPVLSQTRFLNFKLLFINGPFNRHTVISTFIFNRREIDMLLYTKIDMLFFKILLMFLTSAAPSKAFEHFDSRMEVADTGHIQPINSAAAPRAIDIPGTWTYTVEFNENCTPSYNATLEVSNWISPSKKWYAGTGHVSSMPWTATKI